MKEDVGVILIPRMPGDDKKKECYRSPGCTHFLPCYLCISLAGEGRASLEFCGDSGVEATVMQLDSEVNILCVFCECDYELNFVVV